MDFLILMGGIAGLWLGTELTVGGAMAIARRHHLSEFFVGLVILSIGSDLPELAVAVDAGLKGLLGQDASGVVVGTSVGSAVAQIGFVLGLAGMISYLTLPRRFVFRHGGVLLGATALLFVVAFDGQISRTDGMILVGAYGAYVLALMNGVNVPDQQPRPLAGGGFSSWLALVAGLAVVIGSSEITVSSVVRIAHELDISEAVISVLIIGLGTSLPELSISISAILKKRTGLSVGNIIGSNILDTLLPIGVAAMISNLVFDPHILFFDVPYLFVLTVVVLAFFITRRGIERPEAIVTPGLYTAYVAVKLLQFRPPASLVIKGFLC
jgi:cation:H+ antiporter